MTTRARRPRRPGLGLCLALWIGYAFFFGTGSAPAAEAIAWRTDLPSAEREARAQDRLLWIQFTGSWCPNCVRLERESFIHPQVVGHARNSFIPVKIQADQREDLVDRYALGGIPATILMKPTGEVVARHEGFVNAATFQAFLENALVKSGRSPRTGPTLELALAGFCPVCLVDGQRLVPGQPAVSLTHNGRVYRFADAALRESFRKQPERFLPVNEGRCPVTQVDRGEARAGAARWSILYRDHLFLCADEAGRSRFLKDPERYAQAAVPVEARRLDPETPRR